MINLPSLVPWPFQLLDIPLSHSISLACLQGINCTTNSMNSLARPCISLRAPVPLELWLKKKNQKQQEKKKTKQQNKDEQKVSGREWGSNTKIKRGRRGKTTFAATAYLAQGVDEAWRNEVLESKWKAPDGNERGQRIRSENTIRSCLVNTPRCQELIIERTTWWSGTFIFLDKEVCLGHYL